MDSRAVWNMGCSGIAPFVILDLYFNSAPTTLTIKDLRPGDLQHLEYKNRALTKYEYFDDVSCPGSTYPSRGRLRSSAPLRIISR